MTTEAKLSGPARRIAQLSLEQRAIGQRLAEIEREVKALLRELHADPPRCPRCGSDSWTYKGDKQVCHDCGH